MGGVAGALEVPPRPELGLSDPGGVLSVEARHRIEAQLVGYAQDLPDGQKNTARYAVAIFPSLEQESVEDVSMRIAEAWKIGSKKESDGVLLTIFMAEHKLRIEVGYGLEGKLPDVEAARIIRERVAPYMRLGDVEGGIMAALAAIDQHVTGRAHAAPVPPRSPRGQRGTPFVNALLLLFFVVIPMLISLSRRRRGYGGGFGPGFFGGYIAGSGGWSDSGSGFGGGGGSWGGSSGGSFGGGGASGDW